MPLPMPYSCICSPSHIIKAVPLVSVMTVSILNDHPGNCTICRPWNLAGFSSQSAMKNDCMTARRIVPYLVYWTIFL